VYGSAFIKRHISYSNVGWLQMADVLNNVYSDVIDELVVIDCRYPYEYEGGHIPVSIPRHSV